MKQNFVAEQSRGMYPCTVKQWFGQSKIHQYSYETMKAIVQFNLAQTDSIKVLDWGCGNLMWAIGLFPKAEITGVEISNELLGFSEINAQKNGVKFNPLNIDCVDALKNESFDVGIAIALIEILNVKQFEYVFTHIFKKLKHGGILICTFHNWRYFSALYFGKIFKKNAYSKYCDEIGYEVSKKNLTHVQSDFIKLGFKVLESGAFNPYHPRLWKFISSSLFYRTQNKILSHWYCTQYLVLKK